MPRKGLVFLGLFNNGVQSLAEQALDATWYKQQVIQHNIANIDTPDFKAKTVSFGFILNEKCKCSYHEGITSHECHNNDTELPLKLSVMTTYETNTNQILDGNNVDIEKENIALADAQYQYSSLIDYLNSSYSMIRSAISKG